MKTFNTYYINELSLKEFIKQNNIIDSNTTLIQVFTGNNDKNFIGKLILEIDNLLPHSKLIGSTTDGEIKDAKVTANHTVISFNIFKKTTLEVAIFDINNTYFDTGKKLATKIVGDKTKAIISFIDGLGGNGEEFLNGISSVNTNIKIAGGLAGDNAKFNHTFVFTKEHILEHGAVGVSLNSDSLKIYTDFSFHWSSIGVNLKITKAIQNRVYTINDKSAYDTYAYYLGDNVAKKLPALGIEFPLIVKRKEMDIARAVTATMEDGSLIFAGNLQTGDDV
ncbi:MAG: diguanylate cyclase, partial [Epsilonproteobacteria bacterium]|nr:diguanylate cyclase [Campylobacterota bacterium]